jgi:hypothetical protein
MRKSLFVTLLFFFTSSGFGQDVPRTLYVLNGLGRSLSKMALETTHIENDVHVVGNVPNRIYTKGRNIYVVNSTPPGITVIDGQSQKILKTINLPEGSNPYDMAFAGTELAYVTLLLANSIAVVDLQTREILQTIDVGSAPQGILVVDNTAYVANSGGYPDYQPSTVAVIDIQTHQVTKTLDVPMNPQNLALAPDGKLHVVCTGDFAGVTGKSVVIDPFGDADWTPLVVDTVDIGGAPGDIAITNEGIGYLAAYGDGSNGFLYRYDTAAGEVTNDATNPIKVGSGAMALLFDAFGDHLYVNNFADDAVQQLDPQTGAVLNTLAFGHGPQHMAILEPIMTSDLWADAVVMFNAGAGAGLGQNFFPDNVLGPPDPDPDISAVNPSAKPQELLSLGHGGEIVLEFTDNTIIDGQGIDFTVFENAFYLGGDPSQPFIEAAIVAVSQEGENWVEFPYDTTDFSGLAGVTPTKDTQHPLDPTVSGGDGFDLADVGLSFARFVKLTDLGDIKSEGQWNGDFDLDAVVAVNSVSGQPANVQRIKNAQPKKFIVHQNYPNPFNPSTTIEFVVERAARIEINIYNTTGQLIRTLVNQTCTPGRHRVQWHGKNDHSQNVVSGIYFYEIKIANQRQFRPLTLLR